MSTTLPAGLIATALCLGAVVAHQALAPVAAIEEPAPRAVRPEAARRATAQDYRPPGEEQFAVINERALFDPARQPVSEPERSGAPSLSPSDLSLVGVVIDAGHSVALLKKAEAGAATSVRLGQRIEGWQLVRIAPGFVVLRSGVIDFTVKLRQAAGLPQPAIGNASPSETPPPSGH